MDGKQMIKSLIEMAESFDDADSIIEEFTHFRKAGEKLAYLYGMFDVSIVGASDGSTDIEDKQAIDYEAVLTAIVNEKWR